MRYAEITKTKNQTRSAAAARKKEIIDMSEEFYPEHEIHTDPVENQ